MSNVSLKNILINEFFLEWPNAKSSPSLVKVLIVKTTVAVIQRAAYLRQDWFLVYVLAY